MARRTKEPVVEAPRYARDLYAVVMTVWGESCGQGTNVRVLCRDIETAVLVCEGLKKVIPRQVNLNRGDDHINRRFGVEIEPLFPEDVAEFVQEAGL